MAYRLRIRRDAYQGRKWKRGALRASKPPLTLNLAAMVDITFLLLIFFAITASFQRAEGYFAAKLPKVSSRAAVALPIAPVTIRLQQYGPNPGDYRLQLDNFLNAPATFDELTDFLLTVQSNPGFSAETPVVIAAEADVAWDHVVGCWNAAVRAGCKQISFGR
jgi:biopolymer transport protein ExbD